MLVRAHRGAWLRRAACLVALLALIATWPGHAPDPVEAGSVCDPGFQCGWVYVNAFGNGAGTVTGPGINCSVDTTIGTGDCDELHQYQTDSMTVEWTVTAAPGSVFWKSVGGVALAGVPAKEYVFVPSDGGSAQKEIRFTLGVQELQLEIAGPGSGSIRHTDDGVVCPPECTMLFDYGEGVIVVADPDPGSIFVSWDGECVNAGPGCEFEMPKSGTMTVTFGLAPKATATPRPPTPKPTARASAAASAAPSVAAPSPTLAVSPTGGVPSAEPSLASAAPPGASATGTAPATTESGTGAPATIPPISPTGADPGFGSGILLGLALAAVAAGVVGALLWRRRSARV